MNTFTNVNNCFTLEIKDITLKNNEFIIVIKTKLNNTKLNNNSPTGYRYLSLPNTFVKENEKNFPYKIYLQIPKSMYQNPDLRDELNNIKLNDSLPTGTTCTLLPKDRTPPELPCYYDKPAFSLTLAVWEEFFMSTSESCMGGIGSAINNDQAFALACYSGGTYLLGAGILALGIEMILFAIAAVLTPFTLAVDLILSCANSSFFGAKHIDRTPPQDQQCLKLKDDTNDPRPSSTP